jgi:plastocyanin
MKTGTAAALACLALVLVTGCGSSSEHTSGSSTTPATSTTGAASRTTGTGASSTSSTAGAGASLKADTTPKFASPSPSSPVQSGVVQIAYRDIAIAPDTVRVKLGSTVRWTNYDSTAHNVTSEGGPLKFASKNFGEGGTFEIEASRAGVIHYENTLQPATMNGAIEVVG